MKKKIFSIIALMLLIMVVIVSCKKDDAIVNNEQNTEYSARDMYVWEQINTFSSNLKNNNSRDNVLIPVDSVVWYLETTLNFEMSVDTTFGESYKCENTYNLSVDENGFVSLNEISAVYDDMVIDLNNELGHIDSDYKYLLIADLFEQNSRSGNLEIVTNGFIATSVFVAYTPFTQDDNWYYGHMLGREDGMYEGDSDAGQQLKYRINNQHSIPNYNHIWVDVYQSINVIGSPSNPRLFYEVATSAPIIPYTDMQTFLWSIHYYAYNYPDDIPTGLFPEGTLYENHLFRFIHFWTNEEPPSDGKYWHAMNAVYAEPINNPIIED